MAGLDIIDCTYDGAGDAVLYCWLIHSARAAGLSNVRVNLRRHIEIAHMFGVTADMATFEPSDRYWRDQGGGSDQTKYEVANANTIGTRFRAWAIHHGLGDIPPVRPPFIEPKESAEWAEKCWSDRDRDTGRGFRVLICPETLWATRQWPTSYFIDLSHMLWAANCNVVALMAKGTGKDGFPYHWTGTNLYQAASMMARADLVIGCDSGPAHIAGTIGIPTLAVCGPTRAEIVFGHIQNVRGVSIPPAEVPCVGCHFGGNRGFRPACGTGCQALYRLTPGAVYRAALAWIRELTKEAPADAA